MHAGAVQAQMDASWCCQVECAQRASIAGYQVDLVLGRVPFQLSCIAEHPVAWAQHCRDSCIMHHGNSFVTVFCNSCPLYSLSTSM